MIRRDAGDDFLLITQTDHAELASQLAARFGNDRFARPSDRDRVLKAVAMHDSGWPLHDDKPTLNDRGQPLDFLEVSKAIALPLWEGSAARTAEVDPYAGLLVSIHSLSLSILATSPAPSQNEKFDVRKMHDQFDVNKFQHREVERQEQLRRAMRFRMDIPVKHGLAEARASPEDDRLRFDFRLLQAMDLLSLCLCCTTMPANETQDVMPTPSLPGLKLKLWMNRDRALQVKPWPFDVGRIDLIVPCRRIGKRKFETVEAFQTAYRNSQVEWLKLVVSKG